MGVNKALDVGPSGIEVAYECFGEPGAPPVLLIMGLGTQMLGWHEGFCAELAARGLRPIRFDNRDVGLSSHFPDAPVPDFRAALSGDTSSASYNLSDMAADTMGLFDALGIKSAHLVGASEVPTLVIHGAADRMCDVSGGLATADAIKGAELVVIEGMGHSLPRALWPRIASLIANLVQRAEAGTSGASREQSWKT